MQVKNPKKIAKEINENEKKIAKEINENEKKRKVEKNQLKMKKGKFHFLPIRTSLIITRGEYWSLGVNYLFKIIS